MYIYIDGNTQSSLWSVNVNFNLYVLVTGRCSCSDSVKYVSETSAGIVPSSKATVRFAGSGPGKHISERNYAPYDFPI